MQDFIIFVGTSPWGWVVAIVVVLAVSGVLGAVAKAPGRLMQKQFQTLGELRGKRFAEIEKKVGSPTAISVTPDSGTVKQWIASGYHIALVFDKDDLCQGVSHEDSV